jgi:hypothetical protein
VVYLLGHVLEYILCRQENDSSHTHETYILEEVE